MHKAIAQVFALLAACGSATAMQVNPNGLGQVLVFPYYTVNGGNQTLITLSNRTEAGKALRLRFLEGMNGREVLGVNVYLAPNDSWSAAVFSQQEGGPATLVTPDIGCTVPAILTSTTLPQLADGRRVAPFGNAGYTGANDDAGPDTLLRTREGYFEVIEMGEVVDAERNSLRAITVTGDAAAPGNCAGIVAAWASGGYWAQPSDVDMRAPRGGIAAQASIVDATNGTMLSYAPLAIDGFSSTVHHTAPGSASPNLATASSNAQGKVVATFASGEIFETVAARAVDAVSALMIQSTVLNEFATGTSVGGASEWVLSFPTKKFYADDALVGAAAVGPFTRLFSATATAASANTEMPRPTLLPPPTGTSLPDAGEGFDIALWDRDGRGFNADCLGEPPGDVICIPFPVSPPLPPLPTLNWAANVVSFNQVHLAPSQVLGSRLRVDINATLMLGSGEDGRAHIDLTGGYIGFTAPVHILSEPQPGNDTLQFFGLPVIGFWALSVTNSAVTPGVLANYSMQVPHRNGGLQGFGLFGGVSRPIELER